MDISRACFFSETSFFALFLVPVPNVGYNLSGVLFERAGPGTSVPFVGFANTVTSQVSVTPFWAYTRQQSVRSPPN